MKCTIVGYTRLSGTSKKTGNQYDFYVLCLTYKGEKGFTGERVKELNVDPDVVQGIDKLPCPIKADINTGFDGRVSDIVFA